MVCPTLTAGHQANFELLLGIVTFLGLVNKALSIKCVQCTTLTDKGCDSGYLQAIDCKPIEKYKYCLTYTGRINAGLVVFRGCNEEPMDDVCLMKRLENQNVEICYQTCNTTACNSGYAVSGSHSLHMRSSNLLFGWLPVTVALLTQTSFTYRVT